MHVQPMLLMQLENAKALQIPPSPKQKRQQMIPTLSRFLHGQQFLKREGP
jgi:hypothetical protein